MFWADQIARRVIAEKGDKDSYTCAAGITPSGTVHIGNFREIMTVDLFARAMKSLGKKVRFIYSWGDYDRLRKVPVNVPDAEGFQKYLLKPIVMTPDPWKCHKSWADHFENEVESMLPKVGIKPEFIRQNRMYRECRYAEQMRQALSKRDVIVKILNKYRKEPLAGNWWPLRVYCEKCGYESTMVTGWDGEYTVTYTCECGHQASLDFKKKGNAKLPWRVDWPMRWHFEGVDFEPAGKDHSTPGGSRDVGVDIIRAVWGNEPPVYQMYDFVILGAGGKISSSKGVVITAGDILMVYLPEILRFLFAGTKPIKEFEIVMDEGVFKVYEDFYTVERAYYGKEKVEGKKLAQMKRIYEMSAVDKPAKDMPIQPNFKHCVELINIYGTPEKALATVKAKENVSGTGLERYRAILERAKNWIERHAPDRYKFRVQDSVPDSIKTQLSGGQRKALAALAAELGKEWDEEGLFNRFYSIAEEAGISSKEFFQAVYMALIAKSAGPRLAPFILAIGRERVAKLLKSV
jgi:lysyl-tRNA synthetase class 1